MMLDHSRPFQIETDASKYATGAVSVLRSSPVRFFGQIRTNGNCNRLPKWKYKKNRTETAKNRKKSVFCSS